MKLLLALIPLLCSIQLTMILCRRYQSSLSWGMLSSAVLIGSLAVLTTEVLSLTKAISTTSIVCFWVLTATVLTVYQLRLSTEGVRGLQFQWPRDFFWNLMASLLLIFVLLPLALTAYQSAPCTWDSMTYHLPRIEHWVANHQLDYYPTSIDRQLWKDYGAELLLLHLRLLTATDRVYNLLQFFALVGCLGGGVFILNVWGKGRWEKLLSAVFMATIPMAIMQASSTQVDLIGAFWLVAFVGLTLQYLKLQVRRDLVLLSLSLGLALLTRETNYLYAWPFVAWLVWDQVRRGLWGRCVEVLLILSAGIFILNIGHWGRNFILYQQFLSPAGAEGLSNLHWNFSTLMVNAIRNTFMHLTTPVLVWNDQVMFCAESIARWLGLQIQDPSSMTEGRYYISALFLDEDYAQNPLHLILLLAMIVYWIWHLISKNKDQIFSYFMGALILGMATFCLCLKWQPFHSRLHLGIFILAAIPAAVLVARLRRAWVMSLIMLIFLLPSLLWVFRNDNRPWVGSRSIWQTDRHWQYYSKSPAFAFSDKTVSEIFKQITCSQVGLVFGADTWEYPFWVLMKENFKDHLRIEQVGVSNKTSSLIYPRGEFRPCALYVNPSDEKKVIHLPEGVFIKIWESPKAQEPSSAVFIKS